MCHTCWSVQLGVPDPRRSDRDQMCVRASIWAAETTCVVGVWLVSGTARVTCPAGARSCIGRIQERKSACFSMSGSAVRLES